MQAPGLDVLVRKLNGWGFEPLLRTQLTGSYLRATADSFGELHGILTTARDCLDLPITPELYLASGFSAVALTAGTERPLIVLHSAAVDNLDADELLFVIARELGHIKSGHVLYYQMAEFLPAIAEIVGAATFGFGDMLGIGLKVALNRWRRMSEFTADRAGLLACQDADAALRAMMKISALPIKYYGAINTEDFIRQARDFEAMNADTVTALAKWFSTLGSEHPWMVVRAQQLLQWIDRGEYEQVMRAPQRTPPQLPQGVQGYCNQCGWPRAGQEAFCPGCGRPLAAAPGNRWEQGT